jgi:hypothetical protein
LARARRLSYSLSVKLNTERLAVFSQAELRKIAVDAIDAVDQQLEALERALDHGDLATAAEAAHAARNEMLLFGAQELSEAFGLLEHARDTTQARATLADARSLWPATREAIAALHEATG